jgi:excisionase family DNA binding protein
MFDDSIINGYLKVSEIARTLTLSDQTVRTLIRRGEIAPTLRIGGLYLVPRATFADYLKRATVPAAQAA